MCVFCFCRIKYTVNEGGGKPWLHVLFLLFFFHFQKKIISCKGSLKIFDKFRKKNYKEIES